MQINKKLHEFRILRLIWHYLAWLSEEISKGTWKRLDEDEAHKTPTILKHEKQNMSYELNKINFKKEF